MHNNTNTRHIGCNSKQPSQTCWRLWTTFYLCRRSNENYTSATMVIYGLISHANRLTHFLTLHHKTHRAPPFSSFLELFFKHFTFFRQLLSCTEQQKFCINYLHALLCCCRLLDSISLWWSGTHSRALNIFKCMKNVMKNSRVQVSPLFIVLRCELRSARFNYKSFNY